MTLVALLLACLETAFPAVLGRAVDAVISDGSTMPWVAVVVVLVGVLVLADIVDDVLVGQSVAGSTAWLRRRLLTHSLQLSPRTDLAPGDVASRMISGSSEAGRAGPQAVRLVVNLVPGLGSVVALLLIDVRLAATFLVSLPLIMVLARSATRSTTDATHAYQRAKGDISARLGEALDGSRTIAAAGTVDAEVQRVLRPMAALREHGMEMWRVLARASARGSALAPGVEILVLAVAGVLLSRGEVTPGELVAATQYAALGSRLASLEPFVQIARARAGAARLDEVLQQPSRTYGDAVLAPGEGRVELRGVSVLGGPEALHEIDLEVPAQSLVGLTGPIGSGVTTLAAVVARLVDPDAGVVLLDGMPLNELSRSALRRGVGYAPAGPVLLGDTVSDALAFGAADPGREAIVRAALRAQADGFVARLPQGYGTAVAELPFSGGELQRLGIARAFAHAPRVLVLDDVEAGLDTVTAHLVREVLTGPLGGVTRLVVTRRASTAAVLDRVVWLDAGRVRAVAPHHELWESAEYRALFEGEP